MALQQTKRKSLVFKHRETAETGAKMKNKDSACGLLIVGLILDLISVIVG